MTIPVGFDFGGNLDEDGNLVVTQSNADDRELWEKVADGDREWSSADPDGWQYVGALTKSKYDFSGVGVFRSRVNKYAQDFAGERHRLPTESEMLNSGTLDRYLGVLKAGYPTKLPPEFIFQGGYYNNDPYNGPQKLIDPRIPVGAGDGEVDVFANMRFAMQKRNAPFITPEQMAQLMGPPPPTGRRGSGRAARVYDRDQLMEVATDRWKGMLLEEPDEGTVGSLVDSFTAKGNAFWMKQGGNLDFDTFVVNEMRKQSRYETLYAKMTPHLTEEEWMGRYQPNVQQFGLNSSAELREIESGLTSGAGVAGFTERVGRTREARLADGGRFGAQLANQFANMGGMG